MQNQVLQSVVNRLQRYSAKYFSLYKYQITDITWDKPNKKAIITLNNEIYTHQTIIVENIPYAWQIQGIGIDILTNNILINTVNNTILQGVNFSGSLIHIQGVVAKDSNGIENTEASALLNRILNISISNERGNKIISANIPLFLNSVSKYKNLLYYNSFEGEDGFTFDFTNAKVLFYPKENDNLKRINRLYTLNVDFTVDTLDRKKLELTLDDYFCEDPFFESVLVNSNSFLYAQPQIAIGDFQDFNLKIDDIILKRTQLITNVNDHIAIARVEYEGHSQRVSIGGTDDTTATSQVSNVKQNYNIYIAIINVAKPVEQEKTTMAILNAQQIEKLKIDIHNNIVQVLQGYNVAYGFNDLTYSNNINIAVNFDNDDSQWGLFAEDDKRPIYQTRMVIQTVYDEKKIARLENMLVKQPLATGIEFQLNANDLETPKNSIIS